MEKKTLPGRRISKSRLSYAEIAKKISESQWFITTKAHFSFILCVHQGLAVVLLHVFFSPGCKMNHPLSRTLPVLWQKADIMLKHMLALRASIHKWHMPLLLTFHWAKQIVWLSSQGKKVSPSQQGRALHR